MRLLLLMNSPHTAVRNAAKCVGLMVEEDLLTSNPELIDTLLFLASSPLVADRTGAPFALTVRPYSLDALHTATHRTGLVPDGRTYVYVDHERRGVGTAACGPGVLEAYRLRPREADFTLIMRVRS